MLAQRDIERFERDGFLVVPNVISPEQVAKLREYLLDSFDAPSEYESDTPTLRADLCSRHPETRFLLWHKPLVEPLRDLLGEDFVYLPEMAAHCSFFSSWHKDTQTPERAGHDFHWNDDYLMVEAALYLQDNGPRGGGLDVVPGSHRRPVRTRGQRLRAWLRRKRPYSIPSNAGDLVIFHFRIDHRATRPRLRRRPPTGDARKLAIFFACSANNAHVGAYIDFLKTYDAMSYVRSHTYPSELLEQAERENLTLVSR